MTLEDALAAAGRTLDEMIELELGQMEARIRRDSAATGPEDDAALDFPPDPDSPWRRTTVEEALMLARERLLASKAETLADVRRWLEDEHQP